MSKQKVFSTDNTIHYNDYIKIKGANEYLKSIKFNSNNKIINKFKSYEEFITLSKSFYNKSTSNYLLSNDICSIHATQNLYNANISYNDACYLEKENPCSKQFLYPCGIYKDTPKSNMYFPYKINIDKWCINNGKCYQDLEICSEKNCYNCKKKTDNSTQKKCKTGLCKNAKSLFI